MPECLSLSLSLTIARCKYSSNYSCSIVDKVPPAWKQSLEDQRGVRQMVGILSSRKPSLCGASESEEEDRKRKAEIGKERRAGGQEERQEEKVKKELEEQFRMVNLEDLEIEADSD